MERLQQSIQTRGNGWINGELVGISPIKADVTSYTRQKKETILAFTLLVFMKHKISKKNVV